MQVVRWGRSVTHSLTAVATPDVARQFVAAGMAQAPGTAVVVATLSDAGTPLTGVSLSNISLQDSGMSPVGAGPFVIGAAGDIDPALTQTASFGGRSRVAFLNVPVGVLTLKVTITAPSLHTLTGNVVTSPGGVSLTTP